MRKRLPRVGCGHGAAARGRASNISSRRNEVDAESVWGTIGDVNDEEDSARQRARSGLPVDAQRGGGGKDQRFDDDRNGAGVRQHCADIDVVEFLELESVDGDDGVFELHFLAQMNAHEAADVAIARQHQWMTFRKYRREAVGHALAESVETMERRRAGQGTNTATGVSP